MQAASIVKFSGLLCHAIGLCSVLLAGCTPFSVLNDLSDSDRYAKHTDIRYGPEDRQTLDLYLPRSSTSQAPLVVFFYGGGWDDGDKKNYEFVAALLATDGRYLRSAAGDHPPLAGLIGLSGPYDFLPIESGYLLDVFPAETREDSQPINFVTARTPPALLIHGDDDRLVAPGNSLRFSARMQAAGVPVTLKTYEDIGHVAVAMSLAPPLDFIADTLPDTVDFITATEALNAEATNIGAE